ncbi:zinc-dependent metalloprotease, partial [Actinoallomurus acaciae]
ARGSDGRDAVWAHPDLMPTAEDQARGSDGRDAVWAHPDLMPTAEDLDDPAAFVEGKGADIDITDFTEPKPDESGETKPDEEQ